MFHAFASGSALLRTQPALFPRTFTRFKSITAAIEKGRGSGPDRFSPRSASRPRSFRDDEVVSSRYEEREGRSRPSRSKSSIGARRRRWDDDEQPPRRKEMRKSGARSDESAVDRRIREQEREARPERERRPAFRDARPERRDGDRDETSDRPRFTRRDRDGDDYAKSDRRPRTADYETNPRRSPRTDRDARTSQPARSERFDRMDRDRADRTGVERSTVRDDRADRADRQDRPHRSERHPRHRAPDSLPYTTAASEFIYGYSSVLAAIRASRRTFYTLYVNARGINRDILLSRAKSPALRSITREVGDSYDRAFDKASSGRPHNGFILEASPLPVPPITELAETTISSPTFDVTLGPQSKEDLAITGTRTAFPAATHRYPLILYLDSILDEGNLGAIARTAHFLGAEAIITPTRQSAPWSHVALKASAGAAEALPLFHVVSPADFFAKAARNGWRCYAADAPPVSPFSPSSSSSEPPPSPEIIYSTPRSPTPLQDHNPLASHPTILILGSEDKGVRSSLINAAHYKVGIRRGGSDDVGVDSLNVSVAAGLILGDLLRTPAGEREEANVVF